MNTLKFSQKKIKDSKYSYDKNRSAKAFSSTKEQRYYWIMLTSFIILGLVFSYLLLVYKNPVSINSASFIPIVKRRITAIIAIMIAVTCQSLSTVTFQSITNNKVITPSLLGFDALYSTIHTSTMFIFGISTFISFNGIKYFLFQVILMVLFSLFLYGWLLSGKYGDLQLLLLIGVIIGTGLNSVSSFMRRLLAPSEFDILQSRLFGSVNHADPKYFPIAIFLVLISAFILIIYSKKLNIVALGKDINTSLGGNHKFSVIFFLVIISILMSISTALVGPLTFYGFLVATLSYQAANTYDHKYIFPMAFAIGFLILSGAYFFMYHIFNAQGVVSIVIEMFGGITFLFVVLRKGTL